MKNAFRIATALVLLLAAIPTFAQLPKDPEERAKVLKQIFDNNASQLTLFDRAGKEVGRIGSRELQQQAILSPDSKRVAVIRADVERETNDLWVLDAATGKGVQVATGKSREPVSAPVWSPDGKQVAYIALRNGSFELIRRSADGDGPEDVLYKHTGSPITLTDWTADGKFMLFSSNDLGGGILYALPIGGDGKPVQFLKSEKQIRTPRVSPDGKFVAYPSNESGKVEVYVRAFDPTKTTTDSSTGRWQVSDQGSLGMIAWRRDGKELLFIGADRSIMSADVKTAPSFEASKPKVLFRASEANPITPGATGFSRDFDRVMIAVPPPQLRQLTVFDREGKVVAKVGQPGLYNQPNISPDRKRILAMRNDPQTSVVNIWSYDIETGKGTAVTNDLHPHNAPIWAPDGSKIAYASNRDNYSSIYVKAADGSGQEEQVFRYTPGAGMVLTDWSPDGKFITFFTGVLVLAPVKSNQPVLERKAIDWLREDFDVVMGRFSPDGKYMAYLSNEADVERTQVYVRGFDGNSPEKPPQGPVVQVSQGKNASIGMINWRQDGKELYYMTRDFEVMAVDITMEPTLKAGTPRLLFKLQGPLPGNSAQWKNVSPDGQRFVFSMPVR